MKVATVLGARPQFVKAAPLSPLVRAVAEEVLIHTGQHFDANMSEIFFSDLGIPAPAHHLGISGGSHAVQTGAMLPALERVLASESPDLVLVYGDTNSTLAGALCAAKINIPVAHVEAGLRSFNRAMPEEVNRVLTDHVSRWLFAPSQTAVDQLASEGIVDGVFLVGDVMLDALNLFLPRALKTDPAGRILAKKPGGYYLCSIHRQENTDDPERLAEILRGLGKLDHEVAWPIHPRSLNRLAQFGLTLPGRVRALPPLGYLDMLGLAAQARCILTDSGGLQKEAYYLGVPCVTMRDETEWTELLATGWNVLAGANSRRIVQCVHDFRDFASERPALYGDGRACERIVEALFATTY